MEDLERRTEMTEKVEEENSQRKILRTRTRGRVGRKRIRRRGKG